MKIELKENGPIIISANEIAEVKENNSIKLEKNIIAICRCGKSENLPYCDGHHRSCDFKAQHYIFETKD
jgi:CDGSH-type Zn-finger protein